MSQRTYLKCFSALSLGIGFAEYFLFIGAKKYFHENWKYLLYFIFILLFFFLVFKVFLKNRKYDFIPLIFLVLFGIAISALFGNQMPIKSIDEEKESIGTIKNEKTSIENQSEKLKNNLLKVLA